MRIHRHPAALRLASLLLLTLLAPAAAWTESDLSYPSEPLVWGEVNVLATTDLHGWLLGHKHDTWPEPNYSGDIGDIASFIDHLRAKAASKGVDLLLVDSGDHHDGPGLTSIGNGGDASDALLSRLGYDLLAIGNHEMYKYEVAWSVYEGVQGGRWNGAYVTSNSNITLEDGRSVPIGKRVRRFRTSIGRQVTALGVLYGFKANAANMTVQPPAELVKEAWFLDAITPRPDFFLLAGHMPVRGRDADWSLLLAAIRARHPDTPVLVFGGHTHIRDCVMLDEGSMALESGRFQETLGWMSVNFTKRDVDGQMSMSRKYLDNNVRTYKYHTGKDADFETDLGRALRSDVNALATSLNLSIPIGTAPEDYFLSRSMPGAKDSLFTKLMEDVLPAIVTDDKVDDHRERLFLANSGSQRYDVFKGTFTLNDQYVVSPFTNSFVYFDMKAGVARRLLAKINANGATQLLPSEGDHVERTYQDWLAEQSMDWATSALRRPGQRVLAVEEKLTPGYVTRDACPGTPDDTKHYPIRHVKQPIPDYVGSSLHRSHDDDDVRVIVLEFFVNDVVRAARQLDPRSSIEESDARRYAPHLQINDVWGLYAERYWQ